MVNELRGRPRLLAGLLLVIVTAAWGSTFVVVKQALDHASVLDFLSWRFVLAGLLLVAVRPRALARLGWHGWAQGAVLGATVAAGYLLQTYGLRYTPAAISGFLTGLQVVWTPLLGWLILRHRPGSRAWAATLLATAGLAVISLRAFAFGLGEVLTLACAVVFALQIVMLGRWASAEDAYGLATVELLTVGVIAWTAAAPSGIGLPRSGAMWGAVVLTAVAATAFAFVVQSWAQSHLSATATAVVFATEPVFAALFAWVAGERLGWAVAAGGALVVGAMLVMGLGTGAGPKTAPCAGAAGGEPGEGADPAAGAGGPVLADVAAGPAPGGRPCGHGGPATVRPPPLGR